MISTPSNDALDKALGILIADVDQGHDQLKCVFLIMTQIHRD